jgi:hypothetical protein
VLVLERELNTEQSSSVNAEMRSVPPLKIDRPLASACACCRRVTRAGTVFTR